MTAFTCKTQKLPASQLELRVEIPASDFDHYIDRAVLDLSKDLEIKGFRKGQAPKEIAERNLGQGKILEKAINLAVEETYLKTITENEIEAIGLPEVEVLKVARGNPLVYKAKVSILPEVKLPDYQKISKEVIKSESKDVEVKKEEVDKSLTWLQKSRAKFITVTRPAQKGDRVEIKSKVNPFDKQAQGKKSKVNLPEEKESAILGESRLIPELEENLLGMREGEEKNFTAKIPENHINRELAGKDVNFEVRMNLVQKVELSELNDDFAKNLGNFENLDALKKSISEGLRGEKEEREKQRIRMAIIEKIAQESEIEIPKILIDQELEKMIAELKANIQNMGLKFEDYLMQLKTTDDDLKKSWQEDAQKRVSIALALKEIAKKENIAVSDQEVEEKINKDILLPYQKSKGVELERVYAYSERIRVYTRGVLRNEKVFQLLESI